VRLDAVDEAAADAAVQAAAGDAALARRLILDGVLTTDVLSGPAGLPDRMDLVRRWVDTTFALFADDPVTCPT